MLFGTALSQELDWAEAEGAKASTGFAGFAGFDDAEAAPRLSLLSRVPSGHPLAGLAGAGESAIGKVWV